MSYALQSYYTNKPSDGAEVDFAHPLSEGLVGCWLLNERGGRVFKDLAGGNNGYGYDFNYMPNGVSFPAATARIDLPGNPYLNFQRTNSFSTFAVIDRVNTFANSPVIIAKQTTSPFTGWVWQFTSAGFLRYQLINDSSTNILETRTDEALVVNTKYALLSTYNGSSLANGVDHYINGRRAGQTFTNNTLTASMLTSTAATIGCDSSDKSGNTLNGTLVMLTVWNRKLNQEDAMDLTINPFCFISPYEVPILPAPAVTTVFRKTLSPIGSRVGSRQVHGWGE